MNKRVPPPLIPQAGEEEQSFFWLVPVTAAAALLLFILLVLGSNSSEQKATALALRSSNSESLTPSAATDVSDKEAAKQFEEPFNPGGGVGSTLPTDPGTPSPSQKNQAPAPEPAPSEVPIGSAEPAVEDPGVNPEATMDQPIKVLPEESFSPIPDISKSNQGKGGAKKAAYKHRSGEIKGELLKQFGGTEETEAAVGFGLDWLVKNQQPNGSWSLVGPYQNGAIVEHNIAATGLALLCFLGAGHTHLDGEHKEVVEKGLAWLIAAIQNEMRVGNNGLIRRNYNSYSHAIATIALTEGYGLTEDPKLRAPAVLMLREAVSAQSPRGGWRYTPRSDSDLSVTGWFAVALYSGNKAGLISDPEAKAVSLRVSNYLNAVRDPSGYRFRYTETSGATLSMTAEGLLIEQILGGEKDSPSQNQGADYLLANPIQNGQNLPYYWYYASQVMHNYGGSKWEAWNADLSTKLPAMQVQIGPETGSWNPTAAPHGIAGGRLYVTAMHILSLEIYYRHLPIYK